MILCLSSVHEVATAVATVDDHGVFYRRHVFPEPERSVFHDRVGFESVLMPDALPQPQGPLVGLSSARLRLVIGRHVHALPVQCVDGGEMFNVLVFQRRAQIRLKIHSQPGDFAAAVGLYRAIEKSGNQKRMSKDLAAFIDPEYLGYRNHAPHRAQNLGFAQTVGFDHGFAGVHTQDHFAGFVDAQFVAPAEIERELFLGRATRQTLQA